MPVLESKPEDCKAFYDSFSERSPEDELEQLHRRGTDRPVKVSEVLAVMSFHVILDVFPMKVQCIGG